MGHLSHTVSFVGKHWSCPDGLLNSYWRHHLVGVGTLDLVLASDSYELCVQRPHNANRKQDMTVAFVVYVHYRLVGTAYHQQMFVVHVFVEKDQLNHLVIKGSEVTVWFQ